MRCLADTDLIQIIDGSLPHELEIDLEGHLDSCQRCFAIVASLWRGHSEVRRPKDAMPPDGGGGDDLELPQIGRRYLVLALIGQGGMGQVYRALDRLTGRTVALKRVVRRHRGSRRLPTELSQSAGYASCLQQEFRILATLRHPNIISVLDYGFDSQLQPYYTMDLLEDARAILPFSLTLPEPARIALLIQLLHALGYLHRRGILHCDLKPSNLLVVPDREGHLHLKVLDFGLSSGPERIELTALGGTLAYMAPELFCGEPPSEASDLYAAGVVACELLAGGHPFIADAGTSKLLLKVLREPPELGHLPPALQDVLSRTLSKRAADRPPDAVSLLHELCTAVGIANPAEPSAVRDSFLNAARFVGREAELATLTQALREAQNGHGAVFLLSGESGAGKSRLLEELRGIALPAGVLVLRGQSVQSDGTAYHLWREVLRLLALYIDLKVHEAGLLLTIVPDLAALLERPIIRPPQADPQGTGFRLLRALLEVLERTAMPTLVLLEDLQWADPESLQLLAQLSESLADKPLLIVGSYREEEAVTLSQNLAAARHLRLPRLDRQSIARLCESLLGPAAQAAQFLDLMAQETEGNTYFLIEWVRALVVEAGSMDRVGQIVARWLAGGSLPGNVEELLMRRLMRVPVAARPMLRLAAVAGRQFDLGLLRHEIPHLEALIHAAAEVGMLEVHGAEWRFSHDKLREQIVTALAAPERQALHRRVACGLEAVYGKEDARAPAIAHHYHEAGDLERAAFHYARAGEAAFARSAPGEAEGHFEKAIELHERLGASRLARVLAWSGLAQARYALGKLQETFAALQSMFALAGRPLPTAPLPLAAAIGDELYRFIVHRVSRLLHGQPPAHVGEEREVADALRKALSIQEVLVWMARPDLFLVCALRGVNLEEVLETPTAERYLSYGFLFLLAHTPLRRLVIDRLRPEGRPQELTGLSAVSYERIMAMVWLNNANATVAARCAEKAVAVSRELRDDHAIVLSLFQLQLAIGSLEDYSKLLAISQEMERLSLRMQNRRYLAIGLLGQGMSFMRFGDFDRAAEILERARAAIPPEFGIMPLSLVLGQSALCALRRQDLVQAKAQADATMAALEQIPWLMLPLLHSLANALAVYLSLPPAEVEQAKVRRAVTRLAGIGHSFPYARPRAFLYRGRYEAWRRNPLRAQLFLTLSVSAAQAVNLKYEEAEAHEWLSRLGAQAGGVILTLEEAEAHRCAAQSLYERTGARFDAGRMAARSHPEYSSPQMGDHLMMSDA